MTEVYENFIHLSVAVVQSGSDMIEQIGALKVLRRRPEYKLSPRDLFELRKAISKAALALESYDAITRTGPDKSTADQFEAARRESVDA